MKKLIYFLVFIFILGHNAFAESNAEPMCSSILSTAQGQPLMAVWNMDYSLACAAFVTESVWDASMFCLTENELFLSKEEINKLGTNNVLLPSQTLFYVPYKRTDAEFMYIIPTVDMIGQNTIKVRGYDYVVRGGLNLNNNPNSRFVLNKGCYITSAVILTAAEKYTFGQENKNATKRIKVPAGVIINYTKGEIYFKFPQGTKFEFDICTDSSFKECKRVTRLDDSCDLKIGKTITNGVRVERIGKGNEPCFDVDGNQLITGSISVFPKAVRYEAGSKGISHNGLKINANEVVYVFDSEDFCNKQQETFDIGDRSVNDQYVLGCKENKLLKIKGKCFDVELMNPEDYGFSGYIEKARSDGHSLKFFMGGEANCSEGGKLVCESSSCKVDIREKGMVGYASCSDAIEFVHRANPAVNEAIRKATKNNIIIMKPLKSNIESLGRPCFVMENFFVKEGESYKNSAGVCEKDAEMDSGANIFSGEVWPSLTGRVCYIATEPCWVIDKYLHKIFGKDLNPKFKLTTLPDIKKEGVRLFEVNEKFQNQIESSFNGDYYDISFGEEGAGAYLKSLLVKLGKIPQNNLQEFTAATLNDLLKSSGGENSVYFQDRFLVGEDGKIYLYAVRNYESLKAIFFFNKVLATLNDEAKKAVVTCERYNA